LDAKDAKEAAAGKVRELGSFIRDQRKNAQLSLRNLASQAGVSNPYLSQIERGLRKPSAEILQAIASALRISAETLYVKAGILEERDGDLTAAIMSDTTLTEQQRRALLEVYLSFKSRETVTPTEATASGDAATSAPGDQPDATTAVNKTAREA